jgi:deoxyribose-phosphate aldolase
MFTLSPQALAKYIDHTLLRPEATEAEIRKLVAEALEFSFAGVCLEPQWLPTVVPLLKGSPVLAVTVIDFPLGLAPSYVKAELTSIAIDAGAQEIDMVLNRSLLASGKFDEVVLDIRGVVQAAQGTPVKVILETSELSRDQKILAIALSKAAGAHFVKTSTGFSKAGAQVEDVKLMRELVGDTMGVKASGGIRTLPVALKMIEAGASRLGTSASVSLLREAESTKG